MTDTRYEIKKAIDSKLITYDEIAFHLRKSYGTVYNMININIGISDADAQAMKDLMNKKGIINNTNGEGCRMLQHNALEMLSVTTQSISGFAAMVTKATADNSLSKDEISKIIESIDNYNGTILLQLESLSILKKSLMELR